MIDLIRTPDPAPDIPPALAALVKAQSLKPKNIDQILQQSGLPDMETLAESAFLQEYVETMSVINNKATTNMLYGEGLHHATLIEMRRKQEVLVAVTEETRDQVDTVLTEENAQTEMSA